MRKMIVAAAVVAMSAMTAKAEFIWNWWTTSNEGAPAKTEMRGCSLGIASSLDTYSGAQIDLLFNKAKTVRAGTQGSFGYSQTLTLRNGVQWSTVCKAKSAALQIGLICINDTGFLPVFPFFNFDKKMFGDAK